MVAKKLLLNSITKVEEGEKQKREKAENRQRRRLSASCKLHQFFRKKDLDVIGSSTCCV